MDSFVNKTLKSALLGMAETKNQYSSILNDLGVFRTKRYQTTFDILV